MKLIKLSFNIQYLLGIGLEEDIARSILPILSELGKTHFSYLIKKIKTSIVIVNGDKDLISNPKKILELFPFYYKDNVSKIMDQASVSREEAEYANGISEKYGTWVAKLIKNHSIILGEDDEKIKGKLEDFEILINSPDFPVELRDINQYKSYGSLAEMIDKNSNKKSKIQRKKDRARYGQSVIYDKDSVKVTKVTSVSAATSLSIGTEWCTKHFNHASNYLKDGPLYVCEIGGKKVAQIHLESGQIKDVYDDPLVDIDIIVKLNPVLDELNLLSGSGDFSDYYESIDKMDEINEKIKNPETRDEVFNEFKMNTLIYHYVREENKDASFKKMVSEYYSDVLMNEVDVFWAFENIPDEIMPLIRKESIEYGKQYAKRYIIQSIDVARDINNVYQSNLYKFMGCLRNYENIPSALKSLIKDEIREFDTFILGLYRKDQFSHYMDSMPNSVVKMLTLEDLKEISNVYSLLKSSEFPSQLLDIDEFSQLYVERCIYDLKNDPNKLNYIPIEILEKIPNEEIEAVKKRIIEYSIKQIDMSNSPHSVALRLGFTVREGDESFYPYSIEDGPYYFNYHLCGEIINAVNSKWRVIIEDTENVEYLAKLYSEFNNLMEGDSENWEFSPNIFREFEILIENRQKSIIEDDPVQVNNIESQYMRDKIEESSWYVEAWGKKIKESPEALDDFIYNSNLHVDTVIDTIINNYYFNQSEFLFENINEIINMRSDKIEELLLKCSPFILFFIRRQNVISKELRQKMIYSLCELVKVNYYKFMSDMEEIRDNDYFNELDIPELDKVIRDENNKIWYRMVISNIAYYRTEKGKKEIMAEAPDLFNFYEIKDLLSDKHELDTVSGSWYKFYKLGKMNLVKKMKYNGSD